MASELIGVRELSRKLDELPRQAAGKVLRSAAMSATLPVLQEARSRAPVNDRDYLRKTHKGRAVAPGFLKRNLGRKSILSSDKRFVKVMIGPKPEAFYGTAFVELGTSKMAAKPWLRPALESKKAQVLKRIGDLLKDRMEKVARR